MKSKTVNNIFVTSITLLFISSCGVSDYINSRKITKAPVYKEPPKTSQCDFSELRIQRVISYINALRSQSRVCGEKSYPAAPAISWNNKLSLAALTHSDDMADNNFFAHKGSSGLSASERVSNANYNWKTVAENIAGGTDTPEQTLDQWMASPGHCHNLMNSDHTEFGLACTRNNLSDYRVYWTLVLASPNTSQ